MPKHILRTQHEEDVYFVSNTTIQEAFLMLPTEEVNQAIAGAIARAALLHKVKIYGFSVLFHRFYMLLSAPGLNLPKFMKSMQQEIAFELNLCHKRSGKFFAGRYKKSEVRGKDAILERFLAVITAPVKAGLAEDPRDWCGVDSLKPYLDATPFKGTRINRTELGKLTRKSKRKKKPLSLPARAGHEDFQFELARLPGFERQSHAQHRRYIERLITARTHALRTERRGRLADIKALKKLHWATRPDNKGLRKFGLLQADLERPAAEDPLYKETSPQRYQMCYGTASARAAHFKEYKLLRIQYAAGMKKYVEDYDASHFPERTCRPGLIDCERPHGWIPPAA